MVGYVYAIRPPMVSGDTIGHLANPHGTFPLLKMSHPHTINDWTSVNNKYYHWLFTHYDVTPENQTKLLALQGTNNVRYIVFGREICPTSGRKHLQGFISFSNQVRRSTLVKLLGDCWVGPMKQKGTTDECIAYAKKDGDWSEAGEPILTTDRAKGMLYMLGDLESILETISEPLQDEFYDLLSDISDAVYDLVAHFDPHAEELQSSDTESEDDSMPSKRQRIYSDIDHMC